MQPQWFLLSKYISKFIKLSSKSHLLHRMYFFNDVIENTPPLIKGQVGSIFIMREVLCYNTIIFAISLCLISFS